MHVIVSGLGSYGDVLPMVGLGAAMRARGHRVQMMVNPHFRAVVEDAGLGLLPLGTAEEYRALAAHPDRWHAQRGLKVGLDYSLGYLRDVCRLLEAHTGPDSVIAAHGLDLGSRIFHEREGTSLATVQFAPFGLLSLYDTPRYMGAPTVSLGPRWFRAAQFRLAHRWTLDPLVAPAVNAVRAEYGLAPISRIYAGWNQSPQLVLAMFPEWFGALQPDWPPQTHLTGFPLWDPQPAAGLPLDVEAFLQAGDAPLVFAPGSANSQAEAFFRTAVTVCQRLGRRGLLTTPYAAQLPTPLPPTIKHLSFLPFSALLPRAAALIHHGGIGTCAQGLACGLPQIVMPIAYDQLDNGIRLERLGVGAVVPLRKFTPRNVTLALDRLLQTNATAARTREWANRCDGRGALGRACDLLEGLGAAQPASGRRARRDLAAAISGSQ